MSRKRSKKDQNTQAEKRQIIKRPNTTLKRWEGFKIKPKKRLKPKPKIADLMKK